MTTPTPPASGSQSPSTPPPTITPAELDRVLVRAKQDDALAKKIAEAMSLIEGVLDDLGEDAVALSFNGGKDCTVLLHLFAAVLYERHNPVADSLRVTHTKLSLPPASPQPPPNPNRERELPNGCAEYYNAPVAPPPPLPSCVAGGEATPIATHHGSATRGARGAPYPDIRSVYFTAPHPFGELEKFVVDSAAYYGMDLYRFGGGMKAALGEYLGCNGGKEIKAILLGTRAGDPNGAVEVLAPTDASWPRILRVHPVLYWTYDEVWDFLRELEVPYCRLYDEGYTSLGSTHNTERNPLLRRADGGWDPAYMLADPTQERAGRIKRPA